MEIDKILSITDEREQKLWEEAIIVFDSSALLAFYWIPRETRNKNFENLFTQKYKNRFWIPYQVKFEFHKNRASAFKKPIIEKYAPLKNEYLKPIKESIQNLSKNLKGLKNQTFKDDKHPHLSQEKIDAFSKTIENLKKEHSNFESEILGGIKKIESEINDLSSSDDVLDILENFFKVGPKYSYSNLLKITEEGKHRYEFSIPPGYQDLKEKDGFQIFGDLIVWKQILEHAEKEKKSIILISGDLKEDWCYKVKKQKDRIDRPREELLLEIDEVANVDFWMYSLSQFIHNADKYILQSSEDTSNELHLFSETVADILQKSFDSSYDKFKRLRTMKPSRVINQEIYLCHECDGGKSHRNFVSYWYESSIENEYPESHHHSRHTQAYTASCEWCNTLHIECPQCHSVTSVLEYDYDEEFECEGGCGCKFKIETSYDSDAIDEIDIIFVDTRKEKCEKCGNQFIDKHGNAFGMCSNCEDEYNNK